MTINQSKAYLHLQTVIIDKCQPSDFPWLLNLTIDQVMFLKCISHSCVKDSPIRGFRLKSKTTKVVLYLRTSRNALAPAVDIPAPCISRAIEPWQKNISTGTAKGWTQDDNPDNKIKIPSPPQKKEKIIIKQNNKGNWLHLYNT